jgi:hypothetical protein
MTATNEEHDRHLAMLRDEHRMAISQMLNRLGLFVRSRENASQLMLNRATAGGKKARAKQLRDQLDVWILVREKMAELRKDLQVTSLMNRALAAANFNDRVAGDPTEEEIARECERIRAQWTEQEMMRRCNFKTIGVETKPTDFVM